MILIFNFSIVGSFFLFFSLCIILEFYYIHTAKKNGIVDKPNLRSSHQLVTIRGGGIIFPVATLISIFINNDRDIIFTISLILIAVLSFLDDIKSIDSRIRLIVQGIAVLGLVLPFTGIYWYYLIILFIIIIGIINAYNFMDGINGITVLYSLVAIGTFFYVDKCIVDFYQDYFLLPLLSSLVVFAFFNFRKKAICFAGDVGSVSIAFIICYLLLKLSANTEFVYWIFLLGIYGLDTVFTIICRICRHEPLTQAHRSHFYQYLANEAGWGHLKVSILYGFIQVVLNLILINSYINREPILVIFTFVVILVLYSIFRLRLEGFKRLFVSYNPA